MTGSSVTCTRVIPVSESGCSRSRGSFSSGSLRLPWSRSTFVCIFRALGLAKVRWVAPRVHRRDEKRRSELDADTVQALFINRMHVLRDYARRVVLPVCKDLVRGEPRGTVPRTTAKLLIRHPALLADEARRVLADLLARYEVLRRVVEFRDSLQQMCNEAADRQSVSRLREWCVRAEGSGIRALKEFAAALPTYQRPSADPSTGIALRATPFR
jgi:stearoyl-CoA desaturase (delta-9 desaturase)